MGREGRPREPASPTGRRPVTEDLDLRIEAAIETAHELLASGFAVDLGDDFSDEVATSPAPLDGPPGGGLRFVVIARVAGTEFVRFKVDVSAADVVVGDFESYFSDPVIERLGFRRSWLPVHPVNQHFAEKLHALTLPRDVENTRARYLVDLVWFVRHHTFRSEALAIACIATFERRATHPWQAVHGIQRHRSGSRTQGRRSERRFRGGAERRALRPARLIARVRSLAR